MLCLVKIMNEYRVFVAFEDGSFAGFVILTLDDLADTLMSMTGISTISIIKVK